MMIMILIAFFVGFFFKQITGSICGDRLFEGLKYFRWMRIEDKQCRSDGDCKLNADGVRLKGYSCECQNNDTTDNKCQSVTYGGQREGDYCEPDSSKIS